MAGDTIGHAGYERSSSHETFSGVTPAIVPNRLLAVSAFCHLCQVALTLKARLLSCCHLKLNSNGNMNVTKIVHKP